MRADDVTEREDVSTLEPARLWSIPCAVGRHDGCGARLEAGGLLVVCPCSCHVEVVGRCGSCGLEGGRLPCPGCEAVREAPCGCRYTGHAGLRDVRVVERCERHQRRAVRGG